MRCRAAAPLLALAACGFDSNAAAPDAPPADAPHDAAPDAPPDAPPLRKYCDPDEPHLVACYDFEGSATDSSTNRLDAITSNVEFVPGRDGLAMKVDGASSADVADSAKLDLLTLTIEAWVRPALLPIRLGSTAFILDMNGQYALYFSEGGQLTCLLEGAAGAVTTVDAQIGLGEWTHVACTYDGNRALVYVNGGMAQDSGTGHGELFTSSITGMSLGADGPASRGSHFTGLVDQIRLLDIARGPAEICRDAQAIDCLKR